MKAAKEIEDKLTGAIKRHLRKYGLEVPEPWARDAAKHQLYVLIEHCPELKKEMLGYD